MRIYLLLFPFPGYVFLVACSSSGWRETYLCVSAGLKFVFVARLSPRKKGSWMVRQTNNIWASKRLVEVFNEGKNRVVRSDVWRVTLTQIIYFVSFSALISLSPFFPAPFVFSVSHFRRGKKIVIRKGRTKVLESLPQWSEDKGRGSGEASVRGLDNIIN